MRWELKHQHPKKRKISQCETFHMLFSVVMDINWSPQICLKKKKIWLISYLICSLQTPPTKEISLKFFKFQSTYLGWDFMWSLAVKAKQNFLLCIFFLIPSLHFNKVLFLLLLLLEKNCLLASEQPLSWWPYQREMLLVWESCWWEMGREKTWICKIQQQQIFFAKRSVGDLQQKVLKNRENKYNKLCKQNGHSWLVQSQDNSLNDL